MDRATIIETLRIHKPVLSDRYHLTSIGVFGSMCREDFRDDSDVDILIDYNQPLGVEFIDLADELEEMLNRKVDLVSRNGIKSSFFEEIKNDLIYV